ncbi:MAG: hypothetical protein ACK40Q_04395, partial [Pseudothermotoga sp.]
MERRIIKVSSVEELILVLEKDHGPTWYEKVSLQITETTGQIEAVVKPIDKVDSRTAIEELTSIMKIKPTPLPDLSNIEHQYSKPIVRVNISEDKMEASIFIIPGFKSILP